MVEDNLALMVRIMINMSGVAGLLIVQTLLRPQDLIAQKNGRALLYNMTLGISGNILQDLQQPICGSDPPAKYDITMDD